jgi:methyl-accepting chemotaxis protein
MENNNNTREIAEIVENALSEFRRGMEAREQLSIRIGRRTTQIIRFGMFGLSVLGLALFYLIFILTKDFATITDEMERMSGYLDTMEGSFTSVATDMTSIRQTLHVLNDNVMVMPVISRTVGNMDASLAAMSSDLRTVTGQMASMNSNMASVNGNMQIMNKQISDINLVMGHMAGNVNQISKPMKMFPFQ